MSTSSNANGELVADGLDGRAAPARRGGSRRAVKSTTRRTAERRPAEASGVQAADRRRLGDALHGEPVGGHAHARLAAPRAWPRSRRTRASRCRSASRSPRPPSRSTPGGPAPTRSRRRRRRPRSRARPGGRARRCPRGSRPRPASSARSRPRRRSSRAPGRRCRAWITCSSAHGASTSHSSSSSSSFVIGSAPRSPASEPVSPLCANAAATSMPVLVVEPAARVGDRDHGRAVLGEELREVAADVAEALDRDARAVHRDRLLAQRLAEAVERAARGRLLAAERAADLERLAGDDAEHRVALVHRVRVEDPGHHLRVGADVGRRDVLLGADLVDDLARVAARHPLELVAREPLRVADRRRPSRRRTGCPSARTSTSSTSRARAPRRA